MEHMKKNLLIPVLLLAAYGNNEVDIDDNLPQTVAHIGSKGLQSS